MDKHFKVEFLPIYKREIWKAFTTVHVPFTIVHRTFIFVHKKGMKKAVRQTAEIMLYD